MDRDENAPINLFRYGQEVRNCRRELAVRGQTGEQSCEPMLSTSLESHLNAFCV
jgi:hypothetical protein